MNNIGGIFSESLLVSLLGLSIVFIALVAISLIIVMFSKIFSGKEEPIKAPVMPVASAPKAPVVSPEDNGESEMIAAIVAAITEEVGPESIVTSIAEVR